jgi:hypothetical protein
MGRESGNSALQISPLSSFTCQRLAAPWNCTASTAPGATTASGDEDADSDCKSMFSARIANGAAAPSFCASAASATLALPTKRATKAVDGRRYNSRGAASCSMRPMLNTATRSAMDSASPWSCVT